MKISIIGAGRVGSMIAFVLLSRRLASELVLIDIAEGLAKGEALDLRQGQSAIGTGIKISGSSDYSLTEGSDIFIITAGVGRKPGDSRLDLAKKNSEIMRGILERINAKGKIVFIVSNPVDVMTYLALEGLGFDTNRIFGLGTTLDTIRLRSQLSEEFGKDGPFSEAFIIGEHGDSMLPVFSHLGPEFEKERLKKTFEKVRIGGADVIKLKGATIFSPALAVSEVVESIVRDSGAILPVSVYHEDLGVCIGFPARVSKEGARTVEFDINKEEREKFLGSAEIIKREIGKLGVGKNAR